MSLPSARTSLLTSTIALALCTLSCGSPRVVARDAPTALTNEPGLAADPAISPDGLWLAYASDRGGSGVLNLWLRPFAGGDARRLTEGPDDHHEPTFSPDGRTVAYRSEMDGGGVYAIGVDGGPPRLLAKGGRRPRFSPKAGRIVYSAPSGSGSRMGLFLIDTSGGPPRAIHPDFHTANDAAWSPDGKYLIFSGCKDGSAESCDWWVSPADGGEAITTGAAKAFRQHRVGGEPPPDLWLSSNSIVFTVNSPETSHLWTLNLTQDAWRADGTPQRITSGDGEESSPAAGPAGQIVFASRTKNIDIRSLPLDADRAAPSGELTQLTSDPSIDQRPSLSLDGKRIAWETSRGGNFEVWVKDLVSGEEKGLTVGPLREHMPALSRDGSRLVYDTHDGQKVTVFETAFNGGEPVKVWEENVGQGSFQWTAKGDALLYFHREPPGTVGLLNLSTKKRTVLLRHPNLNLSLNDARLSPDGRWIAFPVPFAPHRSRLAVARLSGKVIEDEKDWSYLTPETYNAYQPEWSPNGRWLYFLSDRTGSLAVWALPVSADKKAQGEPKSILRFPSARLTIAEMRPRDIGLAVAKDKLALGVAEYSGKLYSVQR